MGNMDYNSTASSINDISGSNIYTTTISTHRRSESTSVDTLTGTHKDSNSTLNSSSYTTQSAEGSNNTSTEVVLTLETNSESTSSNTLGSFSHLGTTTLLSNSSNSYTLSSSEISTNQINYSNVTTHTVTNIFSTLQTLTLINASQVTTQTLPNSQMTTKTLSEQIITLGVPIATVTSTFTGENQGTTLTTPLFLPSTTIFPNYHFTYTQFYIITADASASNKKREKASYSTVMEILLNVESQPKTETITTNIDYYNENLKYNISTKNMVVLNHFSNNSTSKKHNLGSIIGGTIGGVFGAILLSLIFFKWYVQRSSKSFEDDYDDEEEEKVTVNPINDGFSHHSGRRINIFEESDLLEYYGSPKSSNIFTNLLERLNFKSKPMNSKISDPFNDEFDFKSRQISPPVIVEKSARDIVNESNPFSDGNETSFIGSEAFGDHSFHSFDTRGILDGSNRTEDYESGSNDIFVVDSDAVSLSGDNISLSSLCPGPEIKLNGLLRELV